MAFVGVDGTCDVVFDRDCGFLSVWDFVVRFNTRLYRCGGALDRSAIVLSDLAGAATGASCAKNCSWSESESSSDDLRKRLGFCYSVVGAV